MARKKKTINEMSVKELQAYIRKKTEKANVTISKINKDTASKAVQRELQVLEQRGILGKRGKAVLGFRGKTKEELKAQARELEYFSQWKGTETREKARRRDREKYKSFIRNNPDFKDFSFSDWRTMVELFGTQENWVQSFGYENMKELNKEVVKTGRNVNFVKEIQKVMEQKPVTKEDAIDLLRKSIFQ